MQLDVHKCKELVIDFKMIKHTFDPLIIWYVSELSVVDIAKILGLRYQSRISKFLFYYYKTCIRVFCTRQSYLSRSA